jgi:acyl-CoA thioester hydrolase
LSAIAASLGLSARAQGSDRAALVPREQHIRFHRELRPGAPYVIRGAVLAAKSEGLILYQEMQNIVTRTVAATFVTRVEWADAMIRGGLPLPVTAVAKAAPYTIDLPETGQPRGLDMAPARTAPTLAEAESLGLMTTLRGTVLREHCDAHGHMLLRQYMGRLSDAIPNLIAQTRGEDRSTSSTGGAALEYRFVYRTAAREGDLLVIKSGLRSVSSKTYIWCHWMFDGETGECFATAEAVAVAMDLATRKAIEIPPDMRTQLERLVIPGLSA